MTQYSQIKFSHSKLKREATLGQLGKGQIPQPRHGIRVIEPLVGPVVQFPQGGEKHPTLAGRLGGRRAVQGRAGAVDGAQGRGHLHGEARDRAEQRWVVALEVGLDDARVERVGCDAEVLVSVVDGFGADDGGLFAVAVALPRWVGTRA